MEHHWKNRSSFWRVKPWLFHHVKDFGHANTCSCFTSDRCMKNPCSGFKTEKSQVSKILKNRVSWWFYISLIRCHWTLCVGVGKKNGLLNLHCACLCLWVSWTTARQNNFACWVSPEGNNSYSEAWNWKQSIANEQKAKQRKGTTSPLILVLFDSQLV